MVVGLPVGVVMGMAFKGFQKPKTVYHKHTFCGSHSHSTGANVAKLGLTVTFFGGGLNERAHNIFPQVKYTALYM